MSRHRSYRSSRKVNLVAYNHDLPSPEKNPLSKNVDESSISAYLGTLRQTRARKAIWNLVETELNNRYFTFSLLKRKIAEKSIQVSNATIYNFVFDMQAIGVLMRVDLNGKRYFYHSQARFIVHVIDGPHPQCIESSNILIMVDQVKSQLANIDVTEPIHVDVTISVRHNHLQG